MAIGYFFNRRQQKTVQRKQQKQQCFYHGSSAYETVIVKFHNNINMHSNKTVLNKRFLFFLTER